MKVSTRFGGAAAVVIAAVAAFGMTPASAGVPPIPDLSIKEPGGGFAGDGVYGGGIGQQGYAELGQGQMAEFKIRIQQDTLHVVPITVDGDSSSTHFKVRYFKGQQNITQAVKQGTYVTPPLTAGQQKTIRMEITAKDSVVTGIGFFVTADTPDAVADTVLAEVANCGACILK